MLIEKGILEEFPDVILLAMLREQTIQLGHHNLNAFEMQPVGDKNAGCFTWSKSTLFKNGQYTWQLIIEYKQFKTFFSML